MSRIKHPVRAIREPFGTAGLIVACIALVLALTGAAFAAKGALTGKQKKEVEKIAKKFAGKPGAPGAAGPQGPAGAAGAPGKEGPQGEPGQPGANGKSVVTGNATGGECAEGGITVEVEGSGVKKKVCNGEEGEEGEPGATGATGATGEAGVIHPGETLPKGATETGSWAVSGEPVAFGPFQFLFAPISFPIPLENHPIPVYNPEGNAEEHCTGNHNNPGAEEGYLCIFFGFNYKGKVESMIPFNPENGEAFEGGLTGETLGVNVLPTEETKEAHGFLLGGTWAVTAG
jgi:hypothetical protein